jgi:hypothetical protein
MPVADTVIASVAVTSGLLIGGLQYRRLRGSRGGQVMTSPAGWRVRLNVFLVASGVWTLTNKWGVVALPAAVIAWELTVQASARIRRRAPHAS